MKQSIIIIIGSVLGTSAASGFMVAGYTRDDYMLLSLAFLILGYVALMGFAWFSYRFSVTENVKGVSK